MNYVSMLNFCKNNSVSGAQVYISYEMEYQLGDRFELVFSDTRFDNLCGLVYELYLKAENISITHLCMAVAELESEYQKEEGSDPLTMSKWDIFDKATEYEI